MKSEIFRKLNEIKKMIASDQDFLEAVKSKNKNRKDFKGESEFTANSEELFSFVIKKINLLFEEKKLFLIFKEKNLNVNNGSFLQDLEIEIVDTKLAETNSFFISTQLFCMFNVYRGRLLIEKLKLLDRLIDFFD